MQYKLKKRTKNNKNKQQQFVLFRSAGRKDKEELEKK